MSQSGSVNAVFSNPQIPIDFVTDAGTANASGNTLNILGLGGATTAGAGNTITISAASSTTYTANSGSATPAANNLNVLGSGSIATTGVGDTLTAELTGLTNHAVLVGAGTSTITKLAVGSNGQVLIAANGADPAFATLTSSGGTITFTPGANTLNLESAGLFQPNSTVHEFDDFLSYDSAGIGKLNWTNYGNNSFTLTDGTAAHPGLMVGTAAQQSATLATCLNNGTKYPVVLGGGQVFINWVFDLVTLSTVANRYTVWIGLRDGFNIAPIAAPNNGCYFSYCDNVNSGNWVLNTSNGGVATNQNTATAAATGFVNLGIVVNAAATSVAYYINGTQVGTAITTNIPTNPMAIGFSMTASAGALPLTQVDLMYYTHILTTAR